MADIYWPTKLWGMAGEWCAYIQAFPAELLMKKSLKSAYYPEALCWEDLNKEHTIKLTLKPGRSPAIWTVSSRPVLLHSKSWRPAWIQEALPQNTKQNLAWEYKSTIPACTRWRQMDWEIQGHPRFHRGWEELGIQIKTIRRVFKENLNPGLETRHIAQW